jgi:hypothetical protein
MEGNMSVVNSEYKIKINGFIVGSIFLLCGIILFVWGMNIDGPSVFMPGVAHGLSGILSALIGTITVSISLLKSIFSEP